MIALGAAMALASPPAAAQDKASAEELFQLGKGAMSREDYAKACRYFQASLDAEFALGTLLNLAICHEQAGKIASAWAEYRTLEDRARRATPPQTDRAQFARDRAEALRSRVSRVRIVLSPEAKALPGLVVKIDGVVAAPELFDAGLPVDPGKRAISATAPDHAPWSEVLSVDDDRLNLEIRIPALKPGPPKPANAAGPSVDLAVVERVAAERSQRTVGFVLGGIGIASLATGTVFGLLAVGSADEADCPPAPGSPARSCYATAEDGVARNPRLIAAEEAYDRANVYGWVSNVALAAGVLGIGAGAYLVLSAGKGKSSAVRALPVPIANGGALTLSGDL